MYPNTSKGCCEDQEEICIDCLEVLNTSYFLLLLSLLIGPFLSLHRCRDLGPLPCITISRRGAFPSLSTYPWEWRADCSPRPEVFSSSLE